jgi:radical SAM protein with 4Fe4S-binding SPASM domain
MINSTKPYTLEELCIEITGKCFMNCLHCSSSCTSFNQQELSFNKIKDILREAKKLGTKIIEFSGGEPLLHPQLFDLIYEAKKDFEVRLYTSGYIGRESGIPQPLLASLADLGLDRIIFNLQGASAGIHEQITMTPGSFESVRSSIKRAKAARIWTGVHFVPMLPNYKEVGALAELCSELQVDELAILRFVNQGRGKLNSREIKLSPSDFHSLIMDVVQVKKRVHGPTQVRTGCPMNFCSLVDKGIKPVKCKAGLTTLLIGYDGRIVPCPAFKQGGAYILGNINNSPLYDIWHSNEKLNQLRLFDFREIHGCIDCANINYCQGRCMAQRFYATGSIYEGPDPLCPYKKSYKVYIKKEAAVSSSNA